jgi:NAD(P)-dependent dehydrogenase (short-subunit alcohol dehydrogenase family)
MKLENKVAVITGGNSGIGLATAKLFHKEGAKVVITGRRKEVVEEAAKEVGEGTVGITNDTSKMSDIDSLYEQVGNLHGKIDVLFLNAGIAIFAPIEQVTEEMFDNQFNINTKGLYFNIQKALPLMKAGGSIILTTSSADQMGAPNTSVYSASKAGVRSLARTVSAELLEKGIRVNSIAPGPIETPIFDKLGMPPEMLGQVKEQFAGMVPMKRFGTPDELAKGALFLASDDSSFVAGIDLAVDGGLVSI